MTFLLLNKHAAKDGGLQAKGCSKTSKSETLGSKSSQDTIMDLSKRTIIQHETDPKLLQNSKDQPDFKVLR